MQSDEFWQRFDILWQRLPTTERCYYSPSPLCLLVISLFPCASGVHMVASPCLWVLRLWFQPTRDRKYSRVRCVPVTCTDSVWVIIPIQYRVPAVPARLGEVSRHCPLGQEVRGWCGGRQGRACHHAAFVELALPSHVLRKCVVSTAFTLYLYYQWSRIEQEIKVIHSAWEDGQRLYDNTSPFG